MDALEVDAYFEDLEMEATETAGEYQDGGYYEGVDNFLEHESFAEFYAKSTAAGNVQKLRSGNVVRRKRMTNPSAASKERHVPCRYKLPNGKQCEWTFPGYAKRNRHETRHYNYGAFRCDFCHKLIKHLYNIYDHWRKHCTVISTEQFLFGSPSLQHLKDKVKEKLINRPSDIGWKYIPSDQHIQDLSDRSVLNHCQPCNLCGLNVPLKLFEDHTRAHTGMKRVDEKIYNMFLCHICGFTTLNVKDLYTHWRRRCKEISVYLKRDMTDEEIAAMIYLMLQINIPLTNCQKYAADCFESIREQITAFQENENNEGREKLPIYIFTREHIPFPEEKMDITTHSVPIGECNFNDYGRDTLVDRINLFASACPIFFADHDSPLEWHLQHENNTPARRYLRFRRKVGRLYSPTYISLPILNDYCDPKWHNMKQLKCSDCDMHFTSMGRLERHVQIVHRLETGVCVLCDNMSIGGDIGDIVAHWRKDCEVMKRTFSQKKLEKISGTILREFSLLMLDKAENLPLDLGKLGGMVEEIKEKSLKAVEEEREAAIAKLIKEGKPIPARLQMQNQRCCYCQTTIHRAFMYRHLIIVHNFDGNRELQIQNLLNELEKCNASIEEKREQLNALKNMQISATQKPGVVNEQVFPIIQQEKGMDMPENFLDDHFEQPSTKLGKLDVNQFQPSMGTFSKNCQVGTNTLKKGSLGISSGVEGTSVALSNFGKSESANTPRLSEGSRNYPYRIISSSRSIYPIHSRKPLKHSHNQESETVHQVILRQIAMEKANGQQVGERNAEKGGTFLAQDSHGRVVENKKQTDNLIQNIPDKNNIGKTDNNEANREKGSTGETYDKTMDSDSLLNIIKACAQYLSNGNEEMQQKARLLARIYKERAQGIYCSQNLNNANGEVQQIFVRLSSDTSAPFEQATTYTRDGQVVIGGFFAQDAKLNGKLCFPNLKDLKADKIVQLCRYPKKEGRVVMVIGEDLGKFTPLIWPEEEIGKILEGGRVIPLFLACKLGADEEGGNNETTSIQPHVGVIANSQI